MSTHTPIPVGAALERFAQSERSTTDDGTPARVVVSIWEGDYSQGYKSNYARRPTRWLVIEARHADTGALLYFDRYRPRRRCQRFSGARYVSALSTFDMIIRRDHLTIGTRADASPYYRI